MFRFLVLTLVFYLAFRLLRKMTSPKTTSKEKKLGKTTIIKTQEEKKQWNTSQAETVDFKEIED